ncbi:MAG TPA: hypothetical protein VEW03_16360, partial [Longimicrobiaceae bacterium]|nr:hypothetical protein [Longimicrobiaceae bacterium]
MAPTESASPEDAGSAASAPLPPEAATLTACLRAGGCLPVGSVAGVEVVRRFSANASGLFRLALRYTCDAPAGAPAAVVCKVYTGDWYERNGVDEARFYSRLAG